MLMGESIERQKQKLLPIIRSGNGKFFGFGAPELPEVDNVKGRFAGLLPTKAPDAAMRDLAKTMLQIKSAAPGMAGRNPRLPRSRRR